MQLWEKDFLFDFIFFPVCRYNFIVQDTFLGNCCLLAPCIDLFYMGRLVGSMMRYTTFVIEK